MVNKGGNNQIKVSKPKLSRLWPTNSRSSLNPKLESVDVTGDLHEPDPLANSGESLKV